MASADQREKPGISHCLNCEHNFCQDCVGSLLDTQQEAIVYICPDCQAEFKGATTVETNVKLGNIVQSFYPKQEKPVIFCNYCVHSPVAATKTCLHCDASICDDHLTNHSTKHVLTEPPTSLENRKCSIHKEFVKYYCLEDAAWVCVSCCLIGEHKTHQVELLTKTLTKKKETLKNFMKQLSLRKEETEIKLQTLHEHNQELDEKAVSATDQAIAIFMGIREQLEALEEHVRSQIEVQKQQILSQVCDEIEQLNMKKEELSRKMVHTEKLYATIDPFELLHAQVLEFCDTYDADIDDIKSDVRSASSDLHEPLLSMSLQRLFADIMIDLKGKQMYNILRYPDISLNVNTAGYNVDISNDLKTASYTQKCIVYPLSPERFSFCQVFSAQKFSSGRHYWEVKTSELGYWSVGMAYPSLGRVGYLCHIGKNKKSWCLHMSGKNYFVIHNSKRKMIYPDESSHRFGIYINYDAGQLSFYQLCDSIRHLHTFTAVFTEPLNAALFVGTGGWVQIISQEHHMQKKLTE